MSPPLDPAAAMVSALSDRSVQFSDPDSPWLVRLWVDLEGGRRRIGALRVDSRDASAPVTLGRLAALPLPYLLHVATAHVAAHHAPNEAFYRMLATPRPRGQRQWDEGHYRRVLQVAAWAQDIRRPGGPAQAVADMWGVAIRTAYRWLQG